MKPAPGKLGLILILLLAFGAPGGAWAADPAQGGKARPLRERINDAALVAYDAAIVRPIGATRTLVGGAILAPVALLSLPGGLENVRMAYDTLVGVPFENTFLRPLGDL